MVDEFHCDVFLSHSAKDKEFVRPLAERLCKDGLKVWFDQWNIKPGDSIPSKIEEGLEHSRVLVLCTSANAFASDWPQLEASTFRFRDPLNRERRFIPLRLDDAPIPSSLAQFIHIDWRPADREGPGGDEAYAKLLEACRGLTLPAELTEAQQHVLAQVLFRGHAGAVNSVAWSPNGQQVLSGSSDQTVRVWEVKSGRCLRILACHTGIVRSVAWSPEGQQALSGSEDTTEQRSVKKDFRTRR